MKLWSRKLASATIACVIAAAAIAPSVASSKTPSTSQIQDLAEQAYIWGLAPEFVYRFEKYNDLVTARRNTLGGGSGVASAWNNNATNAGDASVLYLNSMMNLSGRRGRGGVRELVMRVPPSKTNYYVVNLLDSFINTVGSVGTRTTPSKRHQTYLIAGPRSKYAHKRFVRIKGFRFRVLPTDTNLNWMLIRIRANSLVAPSDPTSTATIQRRVVQRFALNTLAQFQRKHNRPTFFKPGTFKVTQHQRNVARRRWHNTPKSAVRFFRQVGRSLRLSPMPKRNTGLQGVPVKSLPNWVPAQARAGKRFRNPSYGQKRTLALFRPIGLTARGFHVPRGWGEAQLTALQQGFTAGATTITEKQSATALKRTNRWSYLNHDVGTYPNTHQGYIYRAVIVQAGGSANLGLDAIYAQANNLNGQSTTQLVGDNTYKLTFRPPETSTSHNVSIGGFPPTVNDAAGNPRGFWSIHIYQTDADEASAPFLTQASVLNTAYSHADLDVVGVDAQSNTLTVQQRKNPWGPLLKSTPILFGPTAAPYGLVPNTPYYLVGDGTTTDNGATYSFQVSKTWQQDLSLTDKGAVPIQGVNGQAGDVVDLQNPGGAVNLQWGPIQPVSQLGSQQMTSGSLARNQDGSVTLWIGPELPAGAPATNWLPTPSKAYYESIYTPDQAPKGFLTEIRPLFRVYYPQPGDQPPSILPPPSGKPGATYVFPKLRLVP